jgi:hypothetical protein
MKIIDAFREFFRPAFRPYSVFCIYDNEGELIYCSSEDAIQQRLSIASLLDRRDANDCSGVYPHPHPAD